MIDIEAYNNNNKPYIDDDDDDNNNNNKSKSKYLNIIPIAKTNNDYTEKHIVITQKINQC